MTKPTHGAKHYWKHREERLATNKAWRIANTEYLKEENRRRKSTPEVAARRRELYRLNREKITARNRERYAKPDVRLRIAAMRSATPGYRERMRAISREWAEKNIERRRVHYQNYRGRKTGKLSRGLATKLFSLQSGKCACCRTKFVGKKYHLDHVMPLLLGGRNEDSNMQLLCPRCNLSKAAKHPVEFMQENGYLL